MARKVCLIQQGLAHLEDTEWLVVENGHVDLPLRAFRRPTLRVDEDQPGGPGVRGGKWVATADAESEGSGARMRKPFLIKSQLSSQPAASLPPLHSSLLTRSQSSSLHCCTSEHCSSILGFLGVVMYSQQLLERSKIYSSSIGFH